MNRIFVGLAVGAAAAAEFDHGVKSMIDVIELFALSPTVDIDIQFSLHLNPFPEDNSLISRNTEKPTIIL